MQSLNLRAALFRCLSDLKKNEVLGKEVILRKTLFDDCKGEKIRDLLCSFSSLVLRKVVADGQGARASVVARLAVAERVTAEEHASFLPLAIAHRASLTALLRRKRDLRTKYDGFRKKLIMKEQELDRRFEAVVQTQEYLDANPIPDHTVARVSKIFETHWQGHSKVVETVMRGNDSVEEDPLLDQPFSNVWPNVSNGTFDVSVKSSSQGLLQNLEKRAADQEARLNQWKEFKESMNAGVRPSPDKISLSPVLARTKSNKLDLQRQRDLVFSPRKSPRKSERDMQSPEDLGSPSSSILTAPATMTKYNDLKLPSPTKSHDSSTADGGEHGRAHEVGEKQHASTGSPREFEANGSDGLNDSGFSEISHGDRYYMDQSQASKRNSSVPQSRHGRATPQARGDGHVGSEESSPKLIGNETSNDLDEDEILANQIISTTLNAAPTPAKAKLSLVERTRQSILASSSPTPFAKPPTEENPNHLPAITETRSPHNTPTPRNPQATLLERTRQSISLVPPKSPSRQSTINDHHRRRTSRIYPTNQFETPRKQTNKQFVTPPEELFSPGAGYDSVFKSRPKVGFSPVASPAPGDGDGGDEGLEGEGSPSVRAGGR